MYAFWGPNAGCHGYDIALLVDELEIVTRKEVGDC